jgi:hypothetical protein
MSHLLLTGLIAVTTTLDPQSRPFIPGASPVDDPLAALQGLWVEEFKEDCAVDATRVELSPDRMSFLVHETDGVRHESTVALVLQARPNLLHIFYKGEKRRTSEGDPLVWAFVFESPTRYKMRRTDWPSDNLTRGTWRKCDQAGTTIP